MSIIRSRFNQFFWGTKISQEKMNKINSVLIGILLFIFFHIEFCWSPGLNLIISATCMYIFNKLPSVCDSGYRKGIISVIGFLCAAFFLLNYSSYSIAQAKNFNKIVDIEIQVLAEKNEQSSGTEVWLTEIDCDFKKISLLYGEFDENWEYRYPRLVTYNGKNTYYKGQFLIKSNIKITFSTGEYSGKVKIRLNGKEKILDLYSKNNQDFLIFEYFCPLYEVDLLYSLVIFILIYLSVRKILLFFLYMWLYAANNKKTVIIYYALIMGIIAVLYWLAYYPGSMTADSMTQWKQMTALTPLTTQHSVVYIMLNWLLTRIWFNPAIVSLFQIIVYILVNCCIFSFYDSKTGRRTVTFIACAVSLYPLNNLTVITLWKDIPYTLAIMELTVILIDIICYNKSFTDKKIFWKTVICFFAILVFRHNGILVAYGTLAVAAIATKQKKHLVMVFSLILCSHILLSGPVYQLLNVQTSGNQMKLGFMPFSDIGYMISKEVSFNENEKDFLNHIFPLDNWHKNYSSFDVNSVYFAGDLNKMYLMENQKEMYKIWLKYCMKYPHYFIKSNLDRTSIVWNPFDINDNKAVSAGGGIIRSIYYPEIFETSKLPYLRQAINKYIVKGLMKTPYLNFIFSRPALFIYLELYLLYKLLKSKKEIWLIFIPNIINILSIAASTPSQETRFLWPSVLLFPIYLLTYLEYNKKQK